MTQTTPMNVDPGWVAFFRDPGAPAGQGIYYSPICLRLVGITPEAKDKSQINIFHWCPPPEREGQIIIAEMHPWFTGIDFLPMRMMAEQQEGQGKGLWTPNTRAGHA